MSEKAVRFADPGLQAGFTQIPNTILRDVDLSGGARLTYAILCSFAWDTDEVWPGQTKLGSLVGVGDRQIRNYLTELEAADLLEIQRRGAMRSNLYVLFGSGHERKHSSGHDRQSSSGEVDEVEEDEKDPPPPTQSAVKSEVTKRIESVWETYVAVMKPRGRGKVLDPESRKLIRDALKVADPEELSRAIETCARSDFHMKRGKHKDRPGGKYNALAQIIKARRGRNETTRSRIEWWLDKADELDAGKEVSFDVNAEAARIKAEQEAD